MPNVVFLPKTLFPQGVGLPLSSVAVGSSTGTGAGQTIPHNLSSVPNCVVITPTQTGLTVTAGSLYADATNIYLTATSGKTYNWYASN